MDNALRVNNRWFWNCCVAKAKFHSLFCSEVSRPDQDQGLNIAYFK